MYDIHSHILPGMDDGAADISDSLEICSVASAIGINTIIATPHFIDGEMESSSRMIDQKIEMLNKEISGRSLNVTILPGMEVFLSPDIVKMYEDGRIIALNHKNYMLIEFSLIESLPLYTTDVLFNLLIKGITPVIAHPERCISIKEHPNLAYRLIEKGCMIQINSGSLMGLYGRSALKTANILLKHNLVQAIASDSHSQNGQIHSFKESYNLVSKKYGASTAERLYIKNPEAIVNGNSIEMGEYKSIEKKKFWIV